MIELYNRHQSIPRLRTSANGVPKMLVKGSANDLGLLEPGSLDFSFEPVAELLRDAEIHESHGVDLYKIQIGESSPRRGNLRMSHAAGQYDHAIGNAGCGSPFGWARCTISIK